MPCHAMVWGTEQMGLLERVCYSPCRLRRMLCSHPPFLGKGSDHMAAIYTHAVLCDSTFKEASALVGA